MHTIIIYLTYHIDFLNVFCVSSILFVIFHCFKGEDSYIMNITLTVHMVFIIIIFIALCYHGVQLKKKKLSDHVGKT